MIFKPTAVEAARVHAIRDYPAEAVGLITPDGYVPLANRARDPRHGFECTEEATPYVVAGTALALVHSHPDGPEGPTAHDMRQQIAMQIPWGITLCTAGAALAPFFWGDSLPPVPLTGRKFRHGPSGTDNGGDCYALVRDWYWLHRGVRLMEGPRDWSWWVGGAGNLYEDNFGRAGFVECDRRELQVGDVLLMRYPPVVPVCNHAAVYVGNGDLMHHLHNRLSCRDAVVRFQRYITRTIRYAGQ